MSYTHFQGPWRPEQRISFEKRDTLSLRAKRLGVRLSMISSLFWPDDENL